MTPPPLSEADTRSIVHLIGNIAVIPGGLEAKRRALMQGICELIGADAWAWTQLHLEDGEAPRQILVLHGGFDDARLAKWTEAIEHPAMKPQTEKLVAEAMAGSPGFTRKATDFVPEEWWQAKEDPAFQLWTEANLRSFMLSAWPLAGKGFSGIGMYRNADREHFGARECRIAHILLSEVTWLREDLPGQEHAGKLMPLWPRHRTTLNLLCEGWPRKKIASELGISEQTVGGYVKTIFRHFDVHSQAELIARVTRGDGRDR
jgi:DNA-binding CsgD family transcriptional regulator